MARLNICIGGESFRRVREEGCCYVDKTGLIEELVDSNRALVSLITRPRRFGKTLTLTMLQEFFDLQKKSNSLFEDLNVYKNTELCREWMNKYPTIFVTFKGIEGQNFSHALDRFALLVSQLCEDYAYLFNSSQLGAETLESLSFLRRCQANMARLEDSLLTLCKALETHWHKPVILLIDEYDVPISCAEQNGYYKEMVSFMRNMLGAVLKTNFSLKFAVLTGCLRIARESIFTGLNNFKCYGISDDRFADKFGFTSREVDSLLNIASFTNKKTLIKEWYDGYRFGNKSEIYCPWDLLQYIDDLQHNSSAEPKAYWNNTSSNAIVRTLINSANRDIKDKIERLIAGEAIEEEIIEELTYDIVYESENNIWSMLYLTGYLTKASEQPKNGNTSLIIPNREVRNIFTDTVSKWFNESIKRRDLSLFVNYLWSGKPSKVQETLTSILYDTISYFDSAENYYHGFMCGLLRGAGLPVSSNRESGLGRSDIVIEDGYKKRAIIIELKCTKRYEELEAKADEGLKQIEDRQYASGLEPHIKNVVKYSIAFWKKESYVKVQQSIQAQ